MEHPGKTKAHKSEKKKTTSALFKVIGVCLGVLFLLQLIALFWGASHLLKESKKSEFEAQNKVVLLQNQVLELMHAPRPAASAKPKVQARSVSQILADENTGNEEEMEAALVASAMREQQNAAQEVGAPAPLPSLDDLMNFDGQGTTASTLSLGNERLHTLIKEARSAQIAGDMRLSILKLEEAQTLHQNHPAILYYYGVTYELLRNTTKARDYYLQVFKQRESAGPFYYEAAKKLEAGFSLVEDKRGKISFGSIQVFKESNEQEGERVTVSLPILLAEGVKIRPEDLRIPVQFFDLINEREIAFTRSQEPKIQWKHAPADWEQGEEVLEVTYFMPKLSTEELMALGDVRYYGFTAKLFYKGEPMDCFSSPNSLILVEQKKNQRALETYDPSGGLLPPLEEAQPASEGLLPVYDASDLPMP